MTKKRLSLIQAIVQLTALVLLFIPICFTRVYCKGIGLGATYNTYPESWLEAADTSGTLFWMIVIFLFAAINITYNILYCTSKLSILKKRYCLAIPCCQAIPLAINTISITNFVDTLSYNASHWYDLRWGFYIVCGLYLTVIMLESLKHFMNIDEEKRVYTSLPTNNFISTNTDEFKKVKELYDQGILTQEEFDAKKKQLLGL